MIGKLDYNAEGLVMLTNNYEFHKILEQSSKKFEYEYIVKVFGRFDEKKLVKIREGCVIKGKMIGPFYVS